MCKKVLTLLVSVLVLLLAAACVGSSQDKSDAAAGNMKAGGEAQAFYAANVKSIITQTCTKCHAGRDEAYASLTEQNALQKIKNVIETDKMPKGKPLDPDQKELVFKWIELAAQ